MVFSTTATEFQIYSKERCQQVADWMWSKREGELGLRVAQHGWDCASLTGTASTCASRAELVVLKDQGKQYTQRALPEGVQLERF